MKPKRVQIRGFVNYEMDSLKMCVFVIIQCGLVAEVVIESERLTLYAVEQPNAR